MEVNYINQIYYEIESDLSNSNMIDSIPIELIVECFSYLNEKDLFSVSLVSKSWLKITSILLKSKELVNNKNISEISLEQCETLFQNEFKQEYVLKIVNLKNLIETLKNQYDYKEINESIRLIRIENCEMLKYIPELHLNSLKNLVSITDNAELTQIHKNQHNYLNFFEFIQMKDYAKKILNTRDKQVILNCREISNDCLFRAIGEAYEEISDQNLKMNTMVEFFLKEEFQFSQDNEFLYVLRIIGEISKKILDKTKQDQVLSKLSSLHLQSVHHKFMHGLKCFQSAKDTVEKISDPLLKEEKIKEIKEFIENKSDFL